VVPLAGAARLNADVALFIVVRFALMRAQNETTATGSKKTS
jgi:hypothetical protein